MPTTGENGCSHPQELFLWREHLKNELKRSHS